jgi:hypothetical protein
MGRDLKKLNKRKALDRKRDCKTDNTKITNGLDGLLERIKIARSCWFLWISCLSTLLL